MPAQPVGPAPRSLALPAAAPLARPTQPRPGPARCIMTERCSLWSALSAAACCFYRGSFVQVQVRGVLRDPHFRSGETLELGLCVGACMGLDQPSQAGGRGRPNITPRLPDTPQNLGVPALHPWRLLS